MFLFLLSLSLSVHFLLFFFFFFLINEHNHGLARGTMARESDSQRFAGAGTSIGGH